LTGIFFAPFLHHDFNHLFFNSVPFFILTNLVLLHGQLNFYICSLIIICGGGLGVWLFGRRAVHIGASGLIMGYFGYLLAEAYYNLSAITIILAVLALYYFGGLIFALIPGARKDVSFSGHLFGFLSGVLAAYFFR
jgi:membrane associated rhomboid family serine protease